MLNLCKDFLSAATDFVNKAKQGTDLSAREVAEFVIQARAAGAEYLGGFAGIVHEQLSILNGEIDSPALAKVPISYNR